MVLDSLWRSKWRRNRYDKKTTREVKRLREAKNYEKANELEYEAEDELRSWEKSIWSRRTQVLIAFAKRLDVPVPNDKDVWRTSEENERYLAPEAQHELHKAIRQEKDDRLNHRMRWVKQVIIPVVSFILGLVTAYFGMKSKR